jgi:DNA polymerase III subunit gamma/tau
MSWYRTYRPVTVAGLHLTNVREQLQAYMSSGKLPQSWLFAGPRGTGKTSSARILAAMVNDPANEAVVDHRFFGGPEPKSPKLHEPDPENELVKRIKLGQALCVIELDAATHRGIDDVRELRERLMLPPPEGKMAVYILDEVHMFTTEAWNALLKILEEPPAHALFVLATTELHKVPATIQSRCAVIRFRLATSAELVGAFKQILKQEKVEFEPVALEAVASAAQGSFRDGVKLLEQLVVQGVPLTADGVATHPTLFQQSAWCAQLRQHIVEKQPPAIVALFQELRNLGFNPLDVHKTLVNWLHQCVVEQAVAGQIGSGEFKIDLFLLQEFAKVAPGGGDVVPLLELEVKSLELVLKSLERSGGGGSSTGGTGSAGGGTKAEIPTKAPVTPPAPKQAVAPSLESPVASVTIDVVEVAPSVILPLPHLSIDVVMNSWAAFVKAVQARSTPVAALLHSATPQVDEGGALVFGVAYSLHKDKLMHVDTRPWLEQLAKDIFGQPVAIKAAVAQVAVQPVVAQTAGSGDNLEDMVSAHVFT